MARIAVGESAMVTDTAGTSGGNRSVGKAGKHGLGRRAR